jgi:hypothetical protein
LPGSEGEGLGAHPHEARVSQQVLDFAGGAAGRVRRGARAAGLGCDGDAPAGGELPVLPHEDITQCPNFNAGITARLAGQPLSRSHRELHGQRPHEAAGSF